MTEDDVEELLRGLLAPPTDPRTRHRHRRLLRQLHDLAARAGIRPGAFAFDASSAEDARQELTLRLLHWSRSGRRADNPAAYIYRMASNLAKDHYRAQARARDRAARALPEEQGSDELCADRLLEERAVDWKAVDAVVDAYAAQAATGRGRGDPQVLAWYGLRVRKRGARSVGEHLREDRAAPPSEGLVAQWASRGAAVVERLARADEDPLRAELMCRALQATA